MENHLSDAIIGAVVISRPVAKSGFLVDVAIPDPEDQNQRNLRDIINVEDWEEVRRFGEHVASREGFRSDPRSVIYPNLSAPSGPYTHFEGVYLVDGGDNVVHLNEPVFDRLITRLLSVVKDYAEETNDPVRHVDWWPRFLTNLVTITQRA